MQCYIIAEAGVNHNGDMRLARELVDAAHESGADAVKFQAFRADDLVAPRAPKAEYQLVTTKQDESQLEMLTRLQLDPDNFSELSQYCLGKGITFLATPFDCTSVDMLDSLGMPGFKIASGEITNYPLLRHVAKKGKPVILSTGMSTLDEVRDALHELQETESITVLHCVTEYPAPVNQVNLQAMTTIRNLLGVSVGYSDHTRGAEIALAAVAMGASVIEKHLTLNRELQGPDHIASLEPKEFKQMVEQIRNIEAALGDGVKRPAQCEVANLKIARRSIFAAVGIAAGTVIRSEMLAYKRPGDGISPRDWEKVIGRRVSRNIEAGEILTWDGLDG